MIVQTEDQLLVFCDLLAGEIEGLSLRLFQNNKVPAIGDVTGDYTVADFSGYANGVVPAFGAAIMDGAEAVATGTPVAFVHNGGGTDCDVYGYYIVDGGGLLVLADRFSGGPVTVEPGVAYVVVPAFRYRNIT